MTMWLLQCVLKALHFTLSILMLMVALQVALLGKQLWQLLRRAWGQQRCRQPHHVPQASRAFQAAHHGKERFQSNLLAVLVVLAAFLQVRNLFCGRYVMWPCCWREESAFSRCPPGK